MPLQQRIYKSEIQEIMKTLRFIVACLALAVVTSCAGDKTPDMNNPVIENIMARRSIRQYSQEPVDREVMTKILECGINAPNGQNRQSWEVRVVNSPELMQEIKDAMAKAGPTLLEPIMKVTIVVPEEYMGDVIGDVSSRRGRIEGSEDINGTKLIRAFVPLAEMFGYTTDLRSRTQGRGNSSMEFDHYEPCPKNIQDKVVAERKGN